MKSLRTDTYSMYHTKKYGYIVILIPSEANNFYLITLKENDHHCLSSFCCYKQYVKLIVYSVNVIDNSSFSMYA